MGFLTRTALLVSLTLNAWLLARVLYPVKRLADRSKRIAEGDMAALDAPCGGIREIGKVQLSMATMAQHVQRSTEEGLSYRHALTDGQEAERARIAHELHDDTVQSLVAIAQSIELATGWVERDPERAKTMLSMARSQAVESVSSLRRLIGDLRPPALEELGISAALKMLADGSADGAIQMTVSGAPRRIDESQELALFRIAQEAVRNAQRHGNAQRITIGLDFQPESIQLEVRDDGGGFVVDTARANGSHFGLIGMYERMDQLGGSLTVTSTPGMGTTVVATLPLEDGEQPAEAVRDPVCGAMIAPQQAYSSTLHNGTRYYFCCPVCQGAFQNDPAAYTGRPVA